jgi:small GTP-binding protein
MISKKMCVLGAFSVGKTSLVERYVHSIFSEKYLSTIGVKISKKVIDVDGTEVTLVLWDMEGEDDYSEINFSYLRGAMGVFIVADGMRRETLDIAMHIRGIVLKLAPDIPHIMIINKADLKAEWEIQTQDIEKIRQQGVSVIETSAKTGQTVDAAFTDLARAMQ